MLTRKNFPENSNQNFNYFISRTNYFGNPFFPFYYNASLFNHDRPENFLEANIQWRCATNAFSLLDIYSNGFHFRETAYQGNLNLNSHYFSRQFYASVLETKDEAQSVDEDYEVDVVTVTNDFHPDDKIEEMENKQTSIFEDKFLI